jgi:hypothetical protein
MSQQSSSLKMTTSECSTRREAKAYQYLDERLTILWYSSVPQTDDEAIDYFTFVRDIGPKFHPKYIAVLRWDSRRYDVMEVWYEEETDEVWDL